MQCQGKHEATSACLLNHNWTTRAVGILIVLINGITSKKSALLNEPVYPKWAHNSWQLYYHAW